jgi:hypothetical protein
VFAVGKTRALGAVDDVLKRSFSSFITVFRVSSGIKDIKDNKSLCPPPAARIRGFSVIDD